jgi:D-alanyl-D-alanine carboxypeptidase
MLRPRRRIVRARTSLPVALVAALAALAAAGCANSHHTAAEPSRLENPAYERVLRKLATDGSSGAVGIVATDTGTWRGAAGWADAHAKRRARPSDRVAIESTTKTFVATVVLQLVGEGRLDLHDTVQQWLPGLFPARPRITIRQLLNHSSGVPSDFGISEPPLVRVKRIAAQGCCLFPPGTSSAYSNSDFVLLGLIVEKVTGRPLDQVVTSRIIRRLHLRSTSYGTALAQRMTPWLGPVESFGRPVSGDGGIISTVDDLATFFRALLGGKLLPQKQLAEMKRTIATDRPDLRYGLGIWRYRVPCGFAWGHGGLASYALDVEVARDGSKAAIWAVNNPALADWSAGDRLYCA